MMRYFAETFWLGDLRMVRAGIALASLRWAWVLLVYDGNFDRPIYSPLRELMPENGWGYCFLAVGAMQLWRAVRGTPVSEGSPALLFGTASCALWCFVAIALEFGVTPAPASNAGNLIWALLSCIILVRAIARRD